VQTYTEHKKRAKATELRTPETARVEQCLHALYQTIHFQHLFSNYGCSYYHKLAPMMQIKIYYPNCIDVHMPSSKECFWISHINWISFQLNLKDTKRHYSYGRLGRTGTGAVQALTIQRSDIQEHSMPQWELLNVENQANTSHDYFIFCNKLAKRSESHLYIVNNQKHFYLYISRKSKIICNKLDEHYESHI